MGSPRNAMNLPNMYIYMYACFLCALSQSLMLLYIAMRLPYNAGI